MKYLTLLLLAVGLVFSCGDSDKADMDGDDDTATMTTPDMADTPVAPTAANPMISSTVDAVRSAGGDLTALPAGAAVSNIDGWISKLGSMDGTDAIVGDLRSLKAELTSGDIDGGKVSGILSSLADQTRSMESKAPGLGAIASALQAGADKLGGM